MIKSEITNLMPAAVVVPSFRSRTGIEFIKKSVRNRSMEQ